MADAKMRRKAGGIDMIYQLGRNKRRWKEAARTLKLQKAKDEIGRARKNEDYRGSYFVLLVSGSISSAESRDKRWYCCGQLRCWLALVWDPWEELLVG